MHAAKKEANRILLPYSLTKKPVANKSAASSTTSSSNPVSSGVNKSKSLATSLAGYGSDSDEETDNSEPVNFFSLDSSVKSSQGTQLEEESTKGRELFSTGASDENAKGSFVGPSLPPEISSKDDLKPQTVQELQKHRVPRLGSLQLPSPSQSAVKSETVVSSNTPSTDREMLEQSSSNNLMSQFYAPAVGADEPLTFKGGVSGRKRAFDSDNVMGPAYPSTAERHNMYSDMVRICTLSLINIMTQCFIHVLDQLNLIEFK